MKKSISWFLALALVCSVGMSAFAAGSKTVVLEVASVTVAAETVVTETGEAVELDEGLSLIVEVVSNVATAEETLTEVHVGGLAELILAVDVEALGLDADADEETIAAAVAEAVDTQIREIFAQSEVVAEIAADESIVVLEVLDINIDFLVQDNATGDTTVYNTDENGKLYATVTIGISNYDSTAGDLYAYHEANDGTTELIPCTVTDVDDEGNAVISFNVSSGSPFTFIQIMPAAVEASTTTLEETSVSSSLYLVVAAVAVVALIVVVAVVRTRKKATDEA